MGFTTQATRLNDVSVQRTRKRKLCIKVLKLLIYPGLTSANGDEMRLLF